MEMTTSRLHIRDLCEADWPALHALRTNPAVYRYNHFGPETAEETRVWIFDTMAHNSLRPRFSHNCSIILRDNDQVIGWIGFGSPSETHKGWGDLDFGYALLPEFWNQGYMSEATQALLDFAFTMTAANSIFATCDVRNPGSARVMEKTGMKRVAQYADGADRAGTPMESYRYLILRHEWEASKGNTPMEIHPATSADVNFMTAHFPDWAGAQKHGERLQRQAADAAVYLIASHAGLPIGHGLLKWGGSTDDHVTSRLQGVCPDVEDLFVLAAWRGRGIGTQMLQAAEQRVFERGYQQVGLSVGVENVQARRLYEHLGFRDAGFGEYVERGAYVDGEGVCHTWEEVCVYLIKSRADCQSALRHQ